MTIANRAIGAPINIWNDHSDSMMSSGETAFDYARPAGAGDATRIASATSSAMSRD
jgi:pyruvate/2-oxoacid:ferredoxin oxidoreductase alpha subunit